MDPHITLPTAAINPHALPRDRSHLDPAALQELARSIASSGLRQPIEVWRLNTPSGTYHYGLISGLRRLTAPRLPTPLRARASRSSCLRSASPSRRAPSPVG